MDRVQTAAAEPERGASAAADQPDEVPHSRRERRVRVQDRSGGQRAPSGPAGGRHAGECAQRLPDGRPARLRGGAHQDRPGRARTRLRVADPTVSASPPQLPSQNTHDRPAPLRKVHAPRCPHHRRSRRWTGPGPHTRPQPQARIAIRLHLLHFSTLRQ